MHPNASLHPSLRRCTWQATTMQATLTNLAYMGRSLVQLTCQAKAEQVHSMQAAQQTNASLEARLEATQRQLQVSERPSFLPPFLPSAFC